MKSTFFISFLLLFTFSLTVCSQTIYRFTYRSPGGNDTVTYDAFFVKYDNGGGFVRVRHPSPDSHNSQLSEMVIQEQYATDKNGGVDTSKLIYEGMKPNSLMGDNTIKFAPVTFWFKISPENNYEPWGVSAKPGDTILSNGNLLSAQFIKSSDLTRDLLLNFFTEKDDFYTNLFGIKSKGGMLTADERKTRMFLIVVASTYDSSIGVSSSTDAQKVVQTFSDVADFLGIRKNLFIDTIFGNIYNKKSVDSILKKRNPSPADMVIFFYSGHGFSQKEQPTKYFPYLDLRDPRIRPRVKPATQTMNIQDIYDLIVKKGARLNLVISDCCNNEVITKKTAGPPPPKSKGSGVKWNWENVKALFMNKTPFSLLMTAATKGEEATGTDNFGGFFTHYFITSLTTYLGPDKANPNWFLVTSEAQNQTILKANSFKTQQHPQALFPKLNLLQ